MTNGSRAYRAFGAKRAELEREGREIAGRIHDDERVMQDIVARQGELFRKLATIHINADLGLPPSVRRSMDARHALIERRRAEADGVKTRLSQLKRTASGAGSVVQALRGRLEEEKAAISLGFDVDPEVVELRARRADLDGAHSKLDEKKRRAEKELAEKRVAFEQDEFFVYLRKRGYGSPAYRAWLGIFRLWDGILARSIGFAEANSSYERLLAVPGWVQERIEALGPEERRVSEAHASLVEKYFGHLKPQQDDIAAKDSEIAGINRSIEAADREIAQINRFLSDAALAEDSELKQIVEDFSRILSDTGLQDLDRLASSTGDTEDDLIVAELRQIKARFSAAARNVQSAKEALFKIERRIKDIEEVERVFRRKGWNDSDHSFRGIDVDDIADRMSRDAFNSGLVIGMLTSAHQEPVRTSYDYGSSRSSSSSGSSSTGGFGGGSSYSTTDSFGGGDSSSTTGGF